MRAFLQAISQTIRCPLNHRWQIIQSGRPTIELCCQKCGQRITHWAKPLSAC